jgi:hypothetical protein
MYNMDTGEMQPKKKNMDFFVEDKEEQKANYNSQALDLN